MPSNLETKNSSRAGKKKEKGEVDVLAQPPVNPGLSACLFTKMTLWAGAQAVVNVGLVKKLRSM